MQRIFAGAATGFALLISGPAHESVAFQAPAYQFTQTFPNRLAALDQRDLRCLALNVYYEARGEQPEGQLAVAHVTLNRLHDARFPKTVCKVVYQPGAFSWTADALNNVSDVREEQAWQLAVVISQMALAGMTEDPTKGAVDFHTTSIHPWWVADKEFIWQMGHHKFYARHAPGTMHASYTKVAYVPKPKPVLRKPAARVVTQVAAKSAPADREDKSEQLASSSLPKDSGNEGFTPLAREFHVSEGHG